MSPLVRKILLAICGSISLGILILGIYKNGILPIVMGTGLLFYYGMYYYFTRHLK